ncbi:MAG: AzlD domain-containing protein [Aerococcus sp.]|nr:AzlD domain-containing protein [Aerococcus sp.]
MIRAIEVVFLGGFFCMMLRVVPMFIAHKAEIPTKIYIMLTYIPTTVFSTMIALDMFFWQSSFNLNPLVNLKIVASLISAAVAYYTKSLTWTMVVGIAALTVLMLLAQVS